MANNTIKVNVMIANKLLIDMSCYIDIAYNNNEITEMQYKSLLEEIALLNKILTN